MLIVVVLALVVASLIAVSLESTGGSAVLMVSALLIARFLI